MEQHKGVAGARMERRLRKKAGGYRIIFTKIPSSGVVQVSAILVRSKDTYK